MSKNLTISDDLYSRLETAARQRGLPKVEEARERFEFVIGQLDLDRQLAVSRDEIMP